MNVTRLIQKKRDGEPLTAEELSALVTGYVSGAVPEYQVAALAMAICFQGMEDSVIAALTEALMESGECLDWTGVDGSRVDKHSTGGQGDKVSLVLAPLAACCGLRVPMVAGRGLGPRARTPSGRVPGSTRRETPGNPPGSPSVQSPRGRPGQMLKSFET